MEIYEKSIITPTLRKKNRVKTLVGTLAIEGNTLGEEKITAILDGKRVLGTVLEIAEVKGAIRAYEALDRFRFDSMDDLLEAHRILMGGILKNAGSFRSINVGVGGKSGVTHVAPPHGRVTGLMKELFNWLSLTDIHPLIKSSVFHFEFEFIHPFSDGNGRLGRLWQSVILCAWKPIFSAIPVENIIRLHQKGYYEALENSGSAGESTPFVEFMLEMILETLQNVPKNVTENVPKNRVEELLEILKANSQTTAKSLAQRFGVDEKTIKRDLEKLKSDGMIGRTGSARKGEWIVNTQNKKESR